MRTQTIIVKVVYLQNLMNKYNSSRVQKSLQGNNSSSRLVQQFFLLFPGRFLISEPLHQELRFPPENSLRHNRLNNIMLVSVFIHNRRRGNSPLSKTSVLSNATLTVAALMTFSISKGPNHFGDKFAQSWPLAARIDRYSGWISTLSPLVTSAQVSLLCLSA